MRRVARIVAAVGVAVGVGGIAATEPRAMAQRKPDPEPAGARSAASTPDLAAFGAAYERAGRPRILVLVGIGAAARDGEEVGATLMQLDQGGIAQEIRATLSEELRGEPRVELVSIEGVREQQKREAELLGFAGERAAVEALARAAEAEMILLVKLTPTDARERGGRFSVDVQGVDVLRGRDLVRFGFVWTEGVSGPQVKEYARQMARKFTEQFARAYAGAAREGRTYTVQVVGLGAEDVARLREGLRELGDITDVRFRGTTAAGAGAGAGGAGQGEGIGAGKAGTVSEFQVTHRGDPLDLRLELARAARERLSVDVADVNTTAGRITLVARERAPAASAAPATERWRVLASPGPEGDEARARLLREYRAAGGGRVALLMARTLSAAELADPVVRREIEQANTIGRGQAGLGDTVVTLVGEPLTAGVQAGSAVNGADAAPSGSGANFGGAGNGVVGLPGRLEGAVADRLGAMFGLTVESPATLRGRLAAGPAAGRRVFVLGELLELALRDQPGQLVFVGVSEPMVEGPAGGGGSGLPGGVAGGDLRVTFVGVRGTEAQSLGAVTVARPGMGTPGGAAGSANLVEDFSLEAAARIADRVWLSLRPPTTLTLRVSGATRPGDASAIGTWIRDNLPDVVDVRGEESPETGEATLRVRYRGDPAAFDQAWRATAATRPFEIRSGEVGSGSVDIRLRDR